MLLGATVIASVVSISLFYYYFYFQHSIVVFIIITVKVIYNPLLCLVCSCIKRNQGRLGNKSDSSVVPTSVLCLFMILGAA